MSVRGAVAVALMLAGGSVLACAQHGVGPAGSLGAGGGVHVGGAPHMAGAPRGQFHGGTVQRFAGAPRLGAPRLQGYRPGIGSGVPVGPFRLRGPVNGDRDGDRDGDDRRGGRGYGYGRGGRFGYGQRYGGPYLNPYGYGYGYPYIYSGLTYAGDLGFGDGSGNDSGYAQGANADDANSGSADDSGGQGGGYDDGQPPVPYTQGNQPDEGPAGYDGGMTYPAGAGYASSGDASGAPYQGGQDQGGQGPQNESIAAARRASGAQGSAAAQTDDAGLFDPTAVTLVFRDGRPQETIHNYALTKTTLYVTGAKRQVIPVSDLDMDATEKLNAAAGVKFELPQ